MYQNGGEIHQIATKLPKGHKMHEIAVIYFKWSQSIPNFSIPRPSKIYPNWDFGFKKFHLATLLRRQRLRRGVVDWKCRGFLDLTKMVFFISVVFSIECRFYLNLHHRPIHKKKHWKDSTSQNILQYTDF
jgi:hypothetical protein